MLIFVVCKSSLINVHRFNLCSCRVVFQCIILFVLQDCSISNYMKAR